MLTSKIPENHTPEGVQASPGRCWETPGRSVTLPGKSGEVAEGFGGVPVRSQEIRDVSGGGGSVAGADFRSLNELRGRN